MKTLQEFKYNEFKKLGNNSHLIIATNRPIDKAAEKYAKYVAIEFLKQREGYSTKDASKLFTKFKKDTK